MTTTQHLSPLILNPDPYLRPIIHMSPFSGKMQPFTEEVVPALENITQVVIDSLTYRKLNATITCNGREAISIALKQIVKNNEDVISIITTSNIGYVSSCVTKEIEKYCRWVFGYKENACAYFIIHEFGRCASIPQSVISSGKPIIEDCAYGFVAKSVQSQIGRYGNYIIYSLPKALTMQYGGILLADSAISDSSDDFSEDLYLLGNLYNGVRNISMFNDKRMAVYRRMQSESNKYGFEEMLTANDADIAHAFIVNLPENINFNDLRSYMNKMGIESSVFYGSAAYFLPCHYLLNDWEISYMFYHLDHCLKSLR